MDAKGSARFYCSAMTGAEKAAGFTPNRLDWPLVPSPHGPSAQRPAGVTCWLSPAAAENCRLAKLYSRSPCTGPCTWRCTSAGHRASAAAPNYRPAGPHFSRPSSPARSCPGRRRASRCTSESTCLSSAAERAREQDRGPQPPPLLRGERAAWPTPCDPHRDRASLRPALPPLLTCKSSCALATAICTFTCSMMSPGSSFAPPPPPEPKSEPKPLSIPRVAAAEAPARSEGEMAAPGTAVPGGPRAAPASAPGGTERSAPGVGGAASPGPIHSVPNPGTPVPRPLVARVPEPWYHRRPRRRWPRASS